MGILNSPKSPGTLTRAVNGRAPDEPLLSKPLTGRGGIFFVRSVYSERTLKTEKRKTEKLINNLAVPSDAADVFLRDRQVTAMTGICRSMRYKLLAAGKFPKPIKIGPKIVAFSMREIEAWLRERIAERDSEAA
jgi:prophage regulatory protein